MIIHGENGEGVPSYIFDKINQNVFRFHFYYNRRIDAFYRAFAFIMRNLKLNGAIVLEKQKNGQKFMVTYGDGFIYFMGNEGVILVGQLPEEMLNKLKRSKLGDRFDIWESSFRIIHKIFFT